MYTIIESPLFTRLWPDYWTETERMDFAVYIATCPEAGVRIRGSGGCRKVRWSKNGTGKSGGVRIVYTLRLDKGAIVLLLLYSKSANDSIPAHVLKQIAEEMGHATE